jgi:hypothetical protein
MANKTHKEVGLQSSLKVVISRIRSQFNSTADIIAAIAVMNAVAMEVLQLSQPITGTGTLLGNVMILDVNIPLDSSNWWQDISSLESTFNNTLASRLVGKFGQVNVGYVNPVSTRTVTATVETDKADWQVRSALSSVGTVVAVS